MQNSKFIVNFAAWKKALILMNHDKNISHTQQQSLAIDIDAKRLCYMIYNPCGNETATVGQIAINADSQHEWCKELENAVYDNPFLLEGFNTCTIAVHARHFVLMPQEIATAGLAQRVLEESFSSVEGEVFTSPINGTDIAIACDVPQAVVPFLRRTFNSPTLLHHLSPLCHYCCSAYAEENGCMHVMIEKDVAHLVATRHGKLLLANTMQYRSLDDLAYFALNAWQSCQMNSMSDKILTSGDNELRQQLAQQLRQWIKYAMPQILPAAALKLDRDAINLPFNLIALALYENN